MLRLMCLQCCLLPALVFAESLPWQRMALVGEARLDFFIWPVYEGRLYSNTGSFSFPDTQPFALAIEYRRDFQGAALVDETRRQWKAMGYSVREDWLSALAALLPDVSRDDVITLFVDSYGHSTLYLNETLLGSIDDPDFSEQFAAIWLSEHTTRPEFTQKLLRKS